MLFLPTKSSCSWTCFYYPRCVLSQRYSHASIEGARRSSSIFYLQEYNASNAPQRFYCQFAGAECYSGCDLIEVFLQVCAHRRSALDVTSALTVFRLTPIYESVPCEGLFWRRSFLEVTSFMSLTRTFVQLSFFQHITAETGAFLVLRGRMAPPPHNGNIVVQHFLLPVLDATLLFYVHSQIISLLQETQKSITHFSFLMGWCRSSYSQTYSLSHAIQIPGNSPSCWSTIPNYSVLGLTK